jgi:hypothetical protein
MLTLTIRQASACKLDKTISKIRPAILKAVPKPCVRLFASSSPKEGLYIEFFLLQLFNIPAHL